MHAYITAILLLAASAVAPALSKPLRYGIQSVLLISNSDIVADLFATLPTALM